MQDAVEAQMGPLLRDNKPRWLGDVKMTRFTMGSKVLEHRNASRCRWRMQARSGAGGEDRVER